MLDAHAGNTRPHAAKVRRALGDANFLRSAAHSPSSPARALRDFFLFGRLKNGLQGMEFGPADELLSRVRKNLGEITVDSLEAVSGSEWITDWTDALEQTEST
jgi:hypothetical protein